MLALTIRLVVSLAVVVGLLLVLTNLAARRTRGGSGSPLKVLHRQALSRSSSISVVAVGERLLVVGATDQSVSFLLEVFPEELVVEAEEPVALPDDPVVVERPALAAAGVPTGALAGSVLSLQTWRQAMAAAMGRET